MIAVVLSSIAGVIAVIAIIVIYNNLVRLKNAIDKSWGDIDVLLKQRSDELANLITTVKGYMKHEQETLEMITAARTGYTSASSVAQKADAEQQMSAAEKSLFAVAENYPDLKASENFIRLQTRISELEDAIADKREFYNDAVTTYNTRIEQLPYLIIANAFSYAKKELFCAHGREREAVTI